MERKREALLAYSSEIAIGLMPGLLEALDQILLNWRQGTSGGRRCISSFVICCGNSNMTAHYFPYGRNL